jgi:hypothetical protein
VQYVVGVKGKEFTGWVGFPSGKKVEVCMEGAPERGSV